MEHIRDICIILSTTCSLIWIVNQWCWYCIFKKHFETQERFQTKMSKIYMSSEHQKISENLIYKKPTDEEIECKKATLGVKFSNDVFLSEAWLIKMNVSYELEDIEQTPLGPCARIKRGKDDDTTKSIV